MGTTVGVGIVVAILVLLPLGAIWAARRWRDPPPDRWAAKRPDETDPGVVEVRLRKRYGLVGDAAWAPVRRAATRGETAPEGLRAATAEYAAARADAIEQQVRRNGRISWIFTGVVVVAVPVAVVLAIVRHQWFPSIYSVYLIGLSVLNNPWLMGKRAARARRAAELNRV